MKNAYDSHLGRVRRVGPVGYVVGRGRGGSHVVALLVHLEPVGLLEAGQRCGLEGDLLERV